MKKIILVIVMLFIVTGCNITKIDNEKLDTIVSNILDNKNIIANTNSIRYKFYLPNNFARQESVNSNEVLYENGNTYVLYVDLVKYKNQTVIEYIEKKDIYFSKSINVDNKLGYIEIEKTNNLYYIEVYYNYATINVKVLEKDINSSIINAATILSSIVYNDTLILNSDLNNVDEVKEKYLLIPEQTEVNSFLSIYEEDIETGEDKFENNLISEKENNNVNEVYNGDY